jgi:hypothetical protein
VSAPSGSSLDDEFAKLEHACQQAAQAIASARTVREAVAAAEVEVPHHLRDMVRTRVPALGRLKRARDLRVEDIVRDQLAAIAREYNDVVATREFDRLKAVDWPALREGYPDIYARAMREGKLILERKAKR